MKVLQSLGHRPEFPPTPFYYRRQSDGVRIESIVGRSIRLTIPNPEWERLLFAIADAGRVPYFGVSSRLETYPNERSLHEVVTAFVTRNDARYFDRDRVCAYVTAVLLHEGTLMIHHQPLGQGREARVVLMRSETVYNDVRYAMHHQDVE